MNFDAIGAAWAPRVLSVLRIVAGLTLFEHGTGKILKFPAVPTMANLNLASMPGMPGSSNWSAALCWCWACSRDRLRSSSRA